MYHPKTLESKWQKFWEEHHTFQTTNPVTEADFRTPKYYVLDMFPYPSGAGLHVGHPKGYTANDIIARYKHAKGFRVLHPMGWDAFGLPAENYAIKTGIHPKITTDNNIATYKKQIQSLGFSYDWDREVATIDSDYYRWTQWIFLKLFERGLAYEQDLPINYCPSCKTGLANEEVLADRTCERCGTTVEKRKIRQWVLKITAYAERLLADVDGLDWPEGIKEMQRNWIGKSEGVEFSMKKVGDETKQLAVYTTRIDTVYGMTYVVLAADHKDVANWIAPEQKSACEKYIAESKSKSDQERTNEGKEKTGVFTGSFVVNPFNGEQIPVWIGDYVLGSYGTGAVMAVPAHDERDFEFAKKMNLPIKQSVANHICYTWDRAMRAWVETLDRQVVDVILENDTWEFLLIEENDPKDFHFIWWGIESWDSEIETVFKETKEESGYNDVEIISAIEWTYLHTEAFRYTKQKNQKTNGRFFHVKLKSHSQIACEVEDGHHKTIWISRDKVGEYITWPAHKKAWDIFVHWNQAMTEDGKLINSAEFTGLTSAEARQKLAEKAESEGFGKKKTNYRLRDWLFSRQRYWGEPIPLIHLAIEDCKKTPHITDISEATDMNLAYILKRDPAVGEDCKGTICKWSGKVRELVIGGKVVSKIYDGLYGKIICDYNLPLELPEVQNYEPAGDGNSPLALVPDFVTVKLASNLTGKRETNTMPQWAGSCWYYLRFMDPKNTENLVDPKIVKYWGEVDSYVGGAEHAVLHLLYARFWHKFLFDIGVVPTSEPFHRLRNQGLILGPDGNKMSKSKGNVINPDDIIGEHGADTFRLYEMSMADFKDPAPWNTDAIIGVRRFLEKALSIFETPRFATDDMKAMKLLHKTIKKVTEDIENYKFNTAISSLMILLNEGLPKDVENALEWKENFAIMLHPFAPHLAEELYQMVHTPLTRGEERSEGGLTQPSAPTGHLPSQGGNTSVYFASWPEYQEFMLVDDEVTIAIQVNGKLRGTHTFLNGVSQEEVAARVMEDPEIAKWTEGLTIVREIFVPNKLYGIVAK